MKLHIRPNKPNLTEQKKKKIFFSSAYRLFSRIEHILGLKEPEKEQIKPKVSRRK